MNDISCAGISVTVGNVTVRDFVDDENPVEFSDHEVSKIEFSCNGKMFRTVKPTPIIMSVTVLGGSQSDRDLYRMWKQFHRRHNDESLSASVVIPNHSMKLNSYNLTNGTMLSAPPGPCPTGEGKAQGRTYTFAFEKSS